MLEGKTVNLRVIEKEDIPLLNEWANNLDVGGDYEFSRQVSRAEMEKNFDKSISEPSPVEWKTFISARGHQKTNENKGNSDQRIY